MFSGEGTGSYASFSLNDDECTAVMDNISTTFPIKFMIENFVPCKSDTFNIYVDRFGAESETITITTPDYTNSATAGMVHNGTSYSFKDKEQNYLYKFEVDLKNGQVSATEQTFNESNERVDVEFTLKLVHTQK